MSSSNALKSSEASTTEAASWFVSDLHLAPERPAATGRFFRFLDTRARGAAALYILGDLFEYWVGDDDLDAPVARETAAHLRALAESGTRVYFIHGNRDFLLAGRYARHAGMTLLADPTLIDLAGVPSVLMHGDTLCTDDRAYQRFRRLTRPGWVKKLLASLPMSLKRRLAGQARAGSEAAKRGKSTLIMDVNADAVADVLRRHQATRLIHGHTHRPARHALDVDGIACERWVLPDWYGDTAGALRCDTTGCRFEAI
jgi:UDP-2,3-diacylglucosamine hydrolase